jgi:hypothetical protein
VHLFPTVDRPKDIAPFSTSRGLDPVTRCRVHAGGMTNTTTEAETALRELAERHGITLTCDSQSALPPALRTLHQEILSAFVDTGRAPRTDWVAERAVDLDLGVDDALEALADADLVHTDDGRMGVAYPFSGSPTPHVVRFDDGPATWAMCAVDALGIPLMTGRDAAITSSDAQTGEAIRIRCEGGHWTWNPTGVVMLVAATSGCSTAAEAACRHIHFFVGHEQAQGYLESNAALEGEICDQATSVEVGRIVFGSLLPEGKG